MADINRFFAGGWKHKAENDFLNMALDYKYHFHRNDHNEPYRSAANCTICEAIRVIVEGDTEFGLMTSSRDLIRELEEGKIPF